MRNLIIALCFIMFWWSAQALAHKTYVFEGEREILASWYGPGFHGRLTANGEIYDSQGITAAHKTLPFDTLLRVTYKDKSIVVRINDRGPYIDGRELDLSEGAARELGCIDVGVCKVTIEIIG